MKRLLAICSVLSLVAVVGCKKVDENGPSAKGTESAEETTDTGPKFGKGVDGEKKVIRIGALNADSGPAAAIGKPYAIGKRILAARINAGKSGLLPDGWTVELIEKDHGYNPTKSIEHYNAIKDDVLFIATSFGTPNTVPLQTKLPRDNLIAFPASLSSVMAEVENTPPFGPSYKVEAARALDFVIEHSGDAKKVKAAVIYQDDDYGEDGRDGFVAAAKKHGVDVIATEPVKPGQKDFVAIVTALKKKGANYVFLTTLPSATGPIVGTAASLKYAPTFIGSTPAWIDAFFIPTVLPPPVLKNFYWVTGLTYWGEDVPGMKDFLAAYKKFKPEGTKPNFYIMASYVQGLVAIEAANRALAAGNLTREGYLEALHTIENWDGGGMFQPITLKTVPYVISTKTRILKPVLDKRTWEVVAPFADPK